MHHICHMRKGDKKGTMNSAVINKRTRCLARKAMIFFCSLLGRTHLDVSSVWGNTLWKIQKVFLRETGAGSVSPFQYHLAEKGSPETWDPINCKRTGTLPRTDFERFFLCHLYLYHLYLIHLVAHHHLWNVQFNGNPSAWPVPVWLHGLEMASWFSG